MLSVRVPQQSQSAKNEKDIWFYFFVCFFFVVDIFKILVFKIIPVTLLAEHELKEQKCQ